ncbi:MAG TPA: hypothetical protein VNS57_14250 [Steroidobacteraceae bacterium]|nr:hypothetical protein [Steroidobacteraceae bacterium]
MGENDTQFVVLAGEGDDLVGYDRDAARQSKCNRADLRVDVWRDRRQWRFSIGDAGSSVTGAGLPASIVADFVCQRLVSASAWCATDRGRTGSNGAAGGPIDHSTARSDW